MEIFEVSLSAKAKNVSFTGGFMPDSNIINTNSSQNFDSADMMAQYQMRVELRLEKTSVKGNTTVALISDGIIYLPEEQTTVRSCYILNNASSLFNLILFYYYYCLAFPRINDR